MKRLLYAKHMLARAAELQGKRSELFVSESLLLLHDASEMVMQVVYEHHNIKPPTPFLDFWLEVPKANLSKPGFYAQMRRLNNLRVGFKHHGTIPNANTVRELDAEVRAFCSSLCSVYLDTQLDQLSLADLIQNRDVADHLRAAETLFAEGKTADALIEIADALESVWQWAEESKCAFVHGLGRSGSRMAANVVPTYEPGLIRHLNIALLRVDLPAYSELCGLLPVVVKSYGGSKQVAWSHEPTATPEQFAAAVSFLTDLAVTVQGLCREPTI